jgi:hypothetical protein
MEALRTFVAVLIRYLLKAGLADFYLVPRISAAPGNP